MNEFCIEYLPVAVRDLNSIIDYISNQLKAPKAALVLLDEIDKRVSMASKFPYSSHKYIPETELEHEYRIIPVKNYLIFYIVKNQIIEIHRVLYSRMDISTLLK